MRLGVAVCAAVALAMVTAVLITTGSRSNDNGVKGGAVALEGREGEAEGGEEDRNGQGLGMYERIMQAVMNFDQNATDCDGLGAICAIGLKNKKTPDGLTSQMAQDWLAQQPWDDVPYQFCSAFSDLNEEELEACLTHFFKPLKILNRESSANSSAQNSTALITDDPRWLLCYHAATSSEVAQLA